MFLTKSLSSSNWRRRLLKSFSHVILKGIYTLTWVASWHARFKLVNQTVERADIEFKWLWWPLCEWPKLLSLCNSLFVSNFFNSNLIIFSFWIELVRNILGVFNLYSSVIDLGLCFNWTRICYIIKI